jgi:general secretion pathway protein G
MQVCDADGDPMRTAVLVALVCLPTFTTAIPAGDEVDEGVQQHLEGTNAASDSAALVAHAKTDIKFIATALDLFRLDNLRYPATEEGLKALVKQPTDPAVFPTWHRGGYLRALRKDPWGHDYRYAYPGTHEAPYDLYSVGPTGDVNTAIGFWAATSSQ